MRKGDDIDPKGLIADAYAIDGIGTEECRSIFLDWALSVPPEVDTRTLLDALLARHGAEGHPMTAVLRAGLEGAQPVGRRGGRRSRLQ